MSGRRSRTEKSNTVLEKIHSLKDRLRSSQVINDEILSLREENAGLRSQFADVKDELSRAEQAGAAAKERADDACQNAARWEREQAEGELTEQALLKQIGQVKQERDECLSKQRELQDSSDLAGRLTIEVEEGRKARAELSEALAKVRQDLKGRQAKHATLKRELSRAVDFLLDPKLKLLTGPDVPSGSVDGRGSPGIRSLLKRLLSRLEQAEHERDTARRALAEVGDEANERPVPPEPPPEKIVGTPRPNHDELSSVEFNLRGLLSDIRDSGGSATSDQSKEMLERRVAISAPTESISVPRGIESSSPPAGAATLVERPRVSSKHVRPLTFLFDLDEAPDHIRLDTVRQLIRSYMSFLKRSPGEALRFPYAGSPDAYLRQHSHNVSKLAMFLGMHFGEKDKDVEVLGLAAILHDVGLAELPDSLVNKREPLTEMELRWIHEHPTIGSRILESIEGLEPEVPLIVRQHHERIDGSGYPEGLRQEKIHRFAKILNLVDGYEALSAPRVYREELLPNESMRVIARPLILTQAIELPGEISEDDMEHPSPSRAMERVVLQTPQVYDPPLVRAFLLCMGYYPLGSYVRLTSGEVARVVGTNGEEVRNPIVKVVLEESGEVPKQSVLIDLLTDKSRFVSHPISGVPYEDL
ncbi:MAG: HD domain-containing protein, partial [Planctomycetota bacterium]|nr:HD domain-containing protein [Planctomycetota bacterium]